MRRFTLLLFFAFALSACRLAPFDDIEASAPIVSLDPPSGYPIGQFGLTLTSYVGESDGVPISRLLAGAGPGSPHIVTDIWTGAELGSLAPKFNGCDDIATDDPDCPPGTGGDLAALPQWRGTRDCVVTSVVRPGLGVTEDEGQLRVNCEFMPAAVETFTPIPEVGFGTSLAALPADNAVGVLLVGAPGEGGGRIYRIRQDNAMPVALPGPDGAGIGASAAFGSKIVAHAIPALAGLDSDAVIVAAAAPGLSRVVVFGLGQVAGETQTVTLGCIDGVDIRAPREFIEEGSGLALGDTDGDGQPEVFIGDMPNERVLRVQISDLVGGIGCTTVGASDDPPSQALACPSVDGVGCLGFGASMAIGDFDGDGDGDLLVGAPRSSAGGAAGGAAFVLPGGASGPDASAAVALFHADMAADDLLGGEVTTVRTGLGGMERDEPVLAATGKGTTYLFLCTGLEGDRVMGTNRCL